MQTLVYVQLSLCRKIKKADWKRLTLEAAAIVAPYLTRHGVPNAYTRDLATANVDAPLNGAVRKLATDDKAMKRLFSDLEFLAILELRYGFLAHTTLEFDRVIAEIESILVTLNGSVDD